ncbi:hypothetical protein M378DRAFT_997134 [Amanita muscaria Koide BX008]|uniref:F-box domain-containing protein n=1 Tax=Amanita muscaria (strain Koide BX008) TaxID=946122 RepID=A0A0C2WTN9_AMAMK|nr:hypothetical protein M378DRAFT_997134 [Amanita muscaria Koide BX008]
MVLPQNMTMDIIREIFKYFSTPLVIPIPDSEDMEPFPWYLGQICSLWRTTFFSMYYEFWSTIIINPPYPAWKETVSVAKMFLERTEGRPFSFSLKAKHRSPILDLFTAESTRWKGLSLYLHHNGENIPLLWRIKNRTPQLRSLAVNYELGLCSDLAVIFKDVPALTHLSLMHVGDWWMDWSLLTKLELRREFDVGRLLRVLSQTINLERLELNRLISNPRELIKRSEESFDPVTLPRLRTLEISSLAMFQFLTTPALQGLYIYKPGKEPVHENCASFFTRSSCQLQRFGALQFRQSDLADILSYMPDLKVLTVCGEILGMQEFGKLMPQLRVLRLPSNCCVASDLHSVPGLKVIVTWSKHWEYHEIPDGFKHSNIQSRKVIFLPRSQPSFNGFAMTRIVEMSSSMLLWLCMPLMFLSVANIF